ncbi:NAD(P)/FAD-dependent oxidoreductase [Tepidibacillus fermentans]|uniref:NADH dehydrogenase n=1 Tax=Tepidibacillus fermentans TaxID=1281767 RepID=A0A4R3KJ27_9BACI|nr:NAD(P)/FAD-dependent oxidoreductase [Tepidibacillus fermentans]TCS83128.1 NADH dehydrogenase [Tepidibacillus fermentans]
MKVLILGAGYGGLMTALQLQKELDYNEAEITIVNKHSYHYITTHLHAPAAGTLPTNRVKIELDDLIDREKINRIQQEVVEISLENKSVKLKDGQILVYDVLVIALGSDIETFGIKGLKEHAFVIRSVNSVRLIREHIEYMFAKYKAEPDHSEYLTFIVGGAGFTGIEFVGELADRVPELCKEFDVNPEVVRIINIEAAPTVLPGFEPNLVEHAMEVLKGKGVEIRTNTPIKEVTAEGVTLANGEQIKSGTVVWTGGVRGNKIIDNLGIETIRSRAKVDPYLRAPGYKDIFIIGDSSIVFDENVKPYPPTAQIAVQEGEYVAKQIVSLIRNGEMKLKPFKFQYRGTVASLGRREAIGTVGRWKIKGMTASLMKQLIDNRYLYSIGGLPLVFKKGKFLG